MFTLHCCYLLLTLFLFATHLVLLFTLHCYYSTLNIHFALPCVVATCLHLVLLLFACWGVVLPPFLPCVDFRVWNVRLGKYGRNQLSLNCWELPSLRTEFFFLQKHLIFKTILVSPLYIFKSRTDSIYT